MVDHELQAALEAARAKIAAGDFRAALQDCKAALKADKTSYEALELVGRAALGIGELGQAELAFKRAADADGARAPAWAGLAEAAAARGDWTAAAEAGERFLTVAPDGEARRGGLVRLAAAYEHLDDPGKAAAVLRQALAAEPPGAPARLPLLCRLADVLLAADAARAAAEVECEAERGDGAEPSPARAREGAAARLAARALDPAASAPHLDSPELAAPPPRLGARSLSVMRIDVLAVQALRDEELGEASTGTALAEIAATAPREARYLRYREEALRRSLLRIFAAPPRSTERQQFRLAALRDAAGVICRGGALSPTPFLSAVWLLEEEEEVKGGAVPVGGQEVGGALPVGGGIQVGAEATIGQGRRDDAAWATENFARRLMHQHPNEPTARALLAIMLRRRTLSAHRLVPSARRRALERLLADAMADGGVDCASGWKALAELQYENRRYAAAAETARAALEWLQRRRARGHEALTQAALGLRLVLAKALRRLGRLDEAERDFRALAGWTTEGEAGFGHMCGSAPTSVHQHALRGLALVALGRGDAPAARSQYERILGKAALGRGPAEHWAHADYGWLLREAGDLQGARAHLERAVEVAEAEGCAVTDSQAGEHRYRLGEVYWALRGRYRAEKQFAYAQFLEAARVEGHAQAPALAALGRYFARVERRGDQAERCFKRALAIDPTVDVAGDGLAARLVADGRAPAALALCRGILARAPAAGWALRRSGFLLLSAGAPAEAAAAFQGRLRAAPGDAAAWEGLGAAYRAMGRLTAALKAHVRAIELDPRRLFSLAAAGALHLALGDAAAALAAHERALELDAEHPAALLGAAAALTASAARHAAAGAPGAAAAELERGAARAARCAARRGSLAAAWKALGDALVLHHAAAPREGHPLLPAAAANAAEGGEEVAAWRRRIAAVRAARRAYAKALHLRPDAAPAWADAAASFHHERHLLRALPGGAPEGATAAAGAAAERLVRGGLRLAPAAPELWAALGHAAAAPAAREHALARALQLDAADAGAWAALAHGYIDAGEGGLAAACLQHARAQDPAAAPVWEAMSALAAARAGVSDASDREAGEYAEHSLALGAGPRGLLTFAEWAARSGRGSEGAALAAAARAAALAPLDAAAHAALGLAREARGDAAGAAAAHGAARALLAAGSADAPAQPPAARSGAALDAAARLNLARALAAAGDAAAAAALYADAEYLGELEGLPEAWLDAARTRAAAGDAGGAAHAAGEALEAAGGERRHAAAAAAAVELLMQLRPDGALDALRARLPALGGAPHAAVKRLWAVAVAAAAAAGDAAGARAAAREAAAWAVGADAEGDAEFAAELRGIAAAGALAAGDAAGAAHAYAKAVRAAPWAPQLRAQAAAAYLAAAPSSARAAGNLLRGAAPAEPADEEPVDAAGLPLLDAALAATAAAVLARPAGAAGDDLRAALAVAVAAAHADPARAPRWAAAAALATHAAAGAPSAAAFGRAHAWCRAAAAAAARFAPDDRALAARLDICASECALHVGGAEEAASAAASALEHASAAVAAPELAAAHRQVARCRRAAGDAAGAEAACTQALAADAAAAPAAAAELAAVLEAAGRGAAAAALLERELVRAPGAGGGLLSLVRSSLLLRLGDVDGARADAERAAAAAPAAGRAAALAARGAALLHAALAPGAEDGAALLGESRRVLSEALAGGDGAALRALLAHVEAAGTARRKQERVESHAAAALRLAPRPVAPQLLRLLGGLTASRRLCARAAHAAPWEAAAWPSVAA